MLGPRRLLRLFTRAAAAWSSDYAFSMSAAIAYYTIFSIAPLLVIVIAVAGALFGRDAVEGEVVRQASDLIGRQGAQFVQALVVQASDTGRGLIAGTLGLIVLLVGATTVFAELQSSLDRIWKVPEREKPSGLWGVLRARILSFGLILGVAFLMMVSLIVSAALAALSAWAGAYLPGWDSMLWVIDIALSLGIFTLLFALIYKLLPSTTIDWHDVWVGSLVTAALFEIGKLGISLYLGRSGMSEVYQAAGSLVVLLAWVYYAALIFLFGAEFTKVYADDHGSRSSRAEKVERVRSARKVEREAQAAEDRQARLRSRH